MRKITSATLMAALLAAVAAPGTAVGATITVWGSTTCQKRFLEPGRSGLRKATGLSLKVVGVGTGKGLLALLRGKTKVSAASDDLAGAIAAAKGAARKVGAKVRGTDKLIYHEIVRDRIVPIVHQSNPVKSLTHEQLRDIHTGRITNWRELGGANMSIRVVTSHPGSATRAAFRKQVMRGAEYVTDAISVRSTAREIDVVSRDEGAIGAVSTGFLKFHPGQTRIVKTADITRPLGLITNGPPTGQARQLIEFYLSEQGQATIN